ncbi:MAG: hypothetical protein F6K40_36325 [Okeania sp. SIO3I5]|uniref:hypothetical protein n=1 Tax=Okeania sp. SIO3I5 TaxID=2607805 RepID=UPI0013BE84EF|nr:hypothetical protein [Okeania sp. SIO3I5]NEQ41369.1 hypothetical protein [Okeania sp. SIO3I5]
MKWQLSIWQITFPLCGVLIFSIGAFTTIQMINGRYLFHLEVTHQGMKIITDVDKRDSGNDSVQEIQVNVREEVKEEDKTTVIE